jgi:glycosyltransferase involved in cell wall biosynthesis
MKIHYLLVKNLLAGGGIETYTREVGRRLVERGHEVTVYSTGGTADSPKILQGMKVVWIPTTRPYWTEKFSGALLATCKMLMMRSPDVIHLHSVAAGSMAALLRLRSAPCVIQMHGIEWSRSRWGAVARSALRAMERCSIACGDVLTAVSKTQCDYFASNYGAHCEYIPTAADIKEHASPKLILDLGLRSREYVLFAARLVPEKGAHYLLRAFRRLNTNCSLVIAGEWPNSTTYRRELLQLAGDDPRIQFLGSVRGRLLEELFSSARMFVLPSEVEGLSISLIEAMSYGLPCVVSDIPENREVIGESGMLFRSRDSGHLEQVLAEGLKDWGLPFRVGPEARRRAGSLFSWERVSDRLEELYYRVSEQKVARRSDLALAAPGSTFGNEDRSPKSVMTSW